MTPLKQTLRDSLNIIAVIAAIVLLSAVAVRGQENTSSSVSLTLVAYAVPREAYGEIIERFQAHWLQQTGQTVRFLESYQGSGTQSRAVAGGFQADIVALALEPDITRLVDAGLIAPDWNANPYSGMVTDSVALLTTRPGNPLGITDWHDLAQPGIELITPNPATSGGARWNILAAYGAARRGYVSGYEGGEDGATAFVSDVIANVEVLDRDARESILTFERGIGDVAITYEHEYFAGIKAGAAMEAIYPRSTLRIQNPVAVVDAYVDARGTREVAEAFVAFLYTQDAQRIFASHGFRPVNPQVAADYGLPVTVPADLPEETVSVALDPAVTFPVVEDLFTIGEFGGWSVAQPTYFGENGSIISLINSIYGAS